MKNQTARLEALEAHFGGGGDDYTILHLLARNDPEARFELGRLVDAAPDAFSGMTQVARIYLEGWNNQGPEDPAEGTEVTIQ
jgi:hypothetical protein